MVQSKETQKLVRICCYCKKVQAEDGTWCKKEVDERVDATHGICTPCYKKEAHIYYFDDFDILDDRKQAIA